jgi:hypothetical protein
LHWHRCLKDGISQSYLSSLVQQRGWFISIFELRLKLYKEMANLPIDAVRTFSGLLLASKTLYAETEAELVSLRK